MADARPTAADFAEFNGLVISSFRANAGRVELEGVQAPVILLHHLGRRSGTERVVPLAYLVVDGGWAVFGSAGGSKWEPDWYLNLLAEPNATIETGKDIVEIRARVAEGRERDDLWLQHKRLHPQWAVYESQASPRTIPVVVLEGRTAPSGPQRASRATGCSDPIISARRS
jgi:deazaflavin-dependent oxidoreductase (nitroreductase family)